MKDFNKDKFNEAVRRKFSGAEVYPGNNVWDGIEAELLKQDNVKMQKRAVFYRNLAASVIFIALISIYFNLQDLRFSNTQTSSINPVELGGQDRNEIFTNNSSDIVSSKPVVKREVNQGFNGAGNQKVNSFPTIAEDNQREELSLGKLNKLEEKSASLAVINNSESKSLIASLSRINRKQPAEIVVASSTPKIEEVSYFAVSALDKEKKTSNIAWNSNVNIGSGNFNPNSEITETPVFSTVSSLNNPGTNSRTLGGDAAVTDNQERANVENLSSEPMQSNISFTFGLNFGVLLNEKWNIKSGLQYGAYRSTSSSSTVLRDRNSDKLFPYHGASSSTEVSDGRVINVISEYELYNDFQIITIPLMVSYKVIDRKFNVALVGGLSADYIINNTLKGGSDQINDIKFSQNDQQAYKSIFASSMAGIEISYPFAEKYAISIMPTYKKALSNVTNNNATFNSVPAFMGLNMSLAYMF